jgi:hypothetical protein
MARTVRDANIGRLLDAEATRLLSGERDLGPRVAAALTAERRRARERRMTVGSVAAAALLVVWLGAAPLGGLGLGQPMSVPHPEGTRRAAETPAATATPFTPGGVAPLTLGATMTATTTRTPRPTD